MAFAILCMSADQEKEVAEDVSMQAFAEERTSIEDSIGDSIVGRVRHARQLMRRLSMPDFHKTAI